MPIGNRCINIDFANGGQIDGMIRAVDGDIKLIDDHTELVRSHVASMNKTQYIEYRKMQTDSRDKVKKLIAVGKSEAGAVTATPFAGDIETAPARTKPQARTSRA